MTLSLIFRFNLRLGGYSIWSATFSPPSISKIEDIEVKNYSEHEHLTASINQELSKINDKKYSKNSQKLKKYSFSRRLFWPSSEGTMPSSLP